MSLKGRLLKGVGANIYSQATVLVLQLVSTPIYITHWGTAGFGFWSMATALLSYLTLSDLGLASAGGVQLMRSLATEDHVECRKIYQSIILFCAGAFCVCLSVGIVTSMIRDYVHPDALSTTFAWVGAYGGLLLFTSAQLAAYRGLGLNGEAVFFISTLILGEGVASALVAYFGGSQVEAAMAMTAIRAAGAIALSIDLARRAQWARMGFHAASVSKIRELLRPGVAALAFPAGLSLNLQGGVLIVGMIVSPQAAGAFAAGRTITRSSLQLANIATRALAPEITRAWANGDQRFAMLVRMNWAIAASVLIPVGLAISIWGNQLLEIWTHHRVMLSPQDMALLAGASAIQGVWFVMATALMATNSHVLFAKRYVLITAVFTAGAALACYWWQLSGLVGTLFVAEIGSLALAAISARQAYQASPPQSQAVLIGGA